MIRKLDTFKLHQAIFFLFYRLMLKLFLREKRCSCVLAVSLFFFLIHMALCSVESIDFSVLRLNKEPPNITFRRKEKGGINLQTTVSACKIMRIEYLPVTERL